MRDFPAPRIMLLDDDPFTLKLIGRVVENLGFATPTAFTEGQAALDSLTVRSDHCGQSELILLDLNMPDMDGIEFVSHLVNRRYTGSLILVSSEDERMMEAAAKLVRARKIRVLGHLHKPVSPEALRALLTQWAPTSVPEQTRSTQAAYAADAVREAIVTGQLVNYYQPKVALADARVVGVETLVRWQHPLDGLVYPDSFIGVAEANGLIDELTRVVLRAALSQARVWRDAGHDLHVAINVSMDNLATPGFADFVAKEAALAGVMPAKITLEATESRLMADLNMPLESLTRLRLKRFRLSIDDFGTGHSSLAQLRDLPFDELKIDRGFVHGACANKTLRAIFETSLDLARMLNMDVVAEGVEDRDDWDFLCHSRCTLAQGYFIARPMPATELSRWLETWAARAREQLSFPE